MIELVWKLLAEIELKPSCEAFGRNKLVQNIKEISLKYKLPQANSVGFCVRAAA